jgi:LacI family transcriptional regulator
MTSTVTTRDVAKASGYGQSTVSMALRNDPRLTESTRELIQRTAHKLGYQTDAVFARLMSTVKRRKVERELQPLAYVLFWPSSDAYYHYPCYREYREGAAARALEFGYSLEDFVVHPNILSPSRLIKILKTRAIPGMLIPPVFLQEHSPEFHSLDVELPCQEHALSTFGYSLSAPAINRITHDHAGGCETALERLASRGYKRVGLVCSQALHKRVQGRWMAGFVVGQQNLSPKDLLPPLILEDLGHYAPFRRWVMKYKPDAILTVEYGIVHTHLARMGLRCPEDIGLAHLDARSTDLPCAGIDQRNHEIGAVAFDLLLAQMLRNERGIPIQRRTVMLEGHWVDGPTLRPASPPGKLRARKVTPD